MFFARYEGDLPIRTGVEQFQLRNFAVQGTPNEAPGTFRSAHRSFPSHLADHSALERLLIWKRYQRLLHGF